MRKGSLGVTFFRMSVCPSVCPQILGNSFLGIHRAKGCVPNFFFEIEIASQYEFSQ